MEKQCELENHSVELLLLLARGREEMKELAKTSEQAHRFEETRTEDA
jgi:hypothetical protein